MNVTDFSSSRKPEEDMLVAIFAQQLELMEKYHEIEAEFRGDLTAPVNLHDKKAQYLLKDFAWRTTEEIAESVEALYQPDCDEKEALLHAQEEVADSLHFICEMGILAGITINDFWESLKLYEMFMDPIAVDSLQRIFNTLDIPGVTRSNILCISMEFVTKLGMTCHVLKNKPWKTTHMLTDIKLFKQRYFEAFRALCKLALIIGMDADDFCDMYFRKAEVNKFRQRSGY